MTRPVTFSEETDPAYSTAFLKKITQVESRRGVELRGTCPRCGDAMDFHIVTEVFRGTTVPGHGAGQGSTDETTVLCTCQENHPARPVGETGCGAYWNIRLTPRTT